MGTVTEKPPNELAGVVMRNIETLIELRRRLERQRSRSDRVADEIGRFAGSLWSVGVHMLLFGGWILINSGNIPGFSGS